MNLVHYFKKDPYGIKLTCGIIVILGIVIIAMYEPPSKQSSTLKHSDTLQEKKEDISILKMNGHLDNEIIKGKYFDTKMYKSTIGPYVYSKKTGERLNEEKGNLYIVLHTSFTNIAYQSEYVQEGELIINDKDHIFRYDQPEYMLDERFHLPIQRINPGVSIDRFIVFKIPEDKFYNSNCILWQPYDCNEREAFIIKLINK